MKKLALTLALCLFANAEVIKIGVRAHPGETVVKHVQDLIEKQGYEVEVITFDNNIVPNLGVEEGELDANFTQTKAYMDDFIKERNSNITAVADVFFSPLGAYSKKIKSINEIKKGSLVYISNDPIECERSLRLLEANNLISLDKNAQNPSVLDITKNPLNLKFIEVDPPQLVRTLNESDFSLIAPHYAINGGLDITKDCLFKENLEKTKFKVVLIVKKGNENTKKTKAIIKAMQSEKMRDFLNKEFKDTILPAF